MPRISYASQYSPVVSADTDVFFPERLSRPARPMPNAAADTRDRVVAVGDIIKTVADSPLTKLLLRAGDAGVSKLQQIAAERKAAQEKEREGGYEGAETGATDVAAWDAPAPTTAPAAPAAPAGTPPPVMWSAEQATKMPAYRGGTGRPATADERGEFSRIGSPGSDYSTAWDERNTATPNNVNPQPGLDWSGTRDQHFDPELAHRMAGSGASAGIPNEYVGANLPAQTLGKGHPAGPVSFPAQDPAVTAGVGDRAASEALLRDVGGGMLEQQGAMQRIAAERLAKQRGVPTPATAAPVAPPDQDVALLDRLAPALRSVTGGRTQTSPQDALVADAAAQQASELDWSGTKDQQPPVSEPAQAPTTAAPAVTAPQPPAGPAAAPAPKSTAAPGKRTLGELGEPELLKLQQRVQRQADRAVSPEEKRLWEGRLGDVATEMQHRQDQTSLETPARLTPERLWERARQAGTSEDQAKVLAAIETADLPVRDFGDLFGNARQERAMEQARSLFPSAPKRTVEEQAADALLARTRANKMLEESGLLKEKTTTEREGREPKIADVKAGTGLKNAQAHKTAATTDPEVGRLTAMAKDADSRRAERDALLAGKQNLQGADVTLKTAQANAANARAKVLQLRRGGAKQNDPRILKLVQDAEAADLKAADAVDDDVAKAVAAAIDDEQRLLDAATKVPKVEGDVPAEITAVLESEDAGKVEKQEAARRLKTWQDAKREWDGAKTIIDRNQGDASQIGKLTGKQAKLQADRDARRKEVKKVYADAKTAGQKILFKRAGVPASGSPGTAPLPPVTFNGQVVPEGGEFESDGKRYRVVNGKRQRIR